MVLFYILSAQSYKLVSASWLSLSVWQRTWIKEIYFTVWQGLWYNWCTYYDV